MNCLFFRQKYNYLILLAKINLSLQITDFSGLF